MTNYSINLSPNLVNISSEGGLDTSVLNGKSLQRTVNGLMIKTNSGRKIVGRLQDNEQFNDEIEKVKDLPEIVSTGGVYILVNNDYVDYEGGEGAEASNLVILMDQIGISYETFTDISSSTFESLSSGSKLLIPELERGSLYPNLSNEAKSAIDNFVGNGGKLIMFAPSSGNLINFINNIFGFSLTGSDINSPISLSVEGAALFSNESSTISDNDATSAINTASLPEGSVSIYEGSGENQTVVAMIPYNSGEIYILGWDWFSAAPDYSQDGGWNHLLQSILEL